MTTNHTPTPEPTTHAPNTRRPWHRRRSTKAAAAILAGGALAAVDAYHAATDPENALFFGALAMAAAALIARGCLEVRPCYRRPEHTAAEMD